MDSDRRHELEHNDLDTELSKLIAFVKNNINRILTVVIVILAIAVAYTYISREMKSRRASIQSRYDSVIARTAMPGAKTEELLAEFNELSDQSSVDWIAANSLLQIGRLHSKQASESADESKRKQSFEKARQTYNQAVDKYDDQPRVVASAIFGLGKIAEDMGNYDEAKADYTRIANDKSLAGYPIQKQAEEALKRIAQFKGRPQLATTRPAWMQDKTPAPKKP
ncbi:MAG TPA: hypothetical protein PKK48_08095 [Phycisphaerae bacterium]|nr:hypothetical protein [Phycisphaerae bacterium]HPS53061.1 hypothetical protein [Phycisphaerae bacterium]